MKWAYGALLSVLLLALGCTQGVPTISSTENLPAIVLETDYFESKNLQSYDLILNGRVSKLVDRLEVSLDGGSTWKVLDSGNSSSAIGGFSVDKASCTQDCRFYGSLKDIGEIWSDLASLPVENEVVGFLRGAGVYGNTEISKFRLKKLKRGFVSVGSLGLGPLGGKSKTLSGAAAGFRVEAGRLESRPLKSTSDASLKQHGVLQ